MDSALVPVTPEMLCCALPLQCILNDTTYRRHRDVPSLLGSMPLR